MTFGVMLIIIGLLFIGGAWLFGNDGIDAEQPYEGLLQSVYAQRLPQAYVIYPEGFRSVDMPIGNARDYANIFGGTVVAVDKKAE